MPKALLTKSLGKGCSLILGVTCLGGTASIPRVHDTLNPRCFNFGNHLIGRERRIQPNHSNNSEAYTGNIQHRDLDSRIGRAIVATAYENPCYEGASTFGGFWSWSGAQDGTRKLTRHNKKDFFSNVMGCDTTTLNKLWKKIKPWWEKALGEKWSTLKARLDNYLKDTEEWKSWSQFFEFFNDCLDTVDEFEERLKSLEQYSQPSDWGEMFSWTGMHDKVTVKVELTEADGDATVGWSKCGSNSIR